jgi:DNA polymerase-3 subunit gamma/tau
MTTMTYLALARQYRPKSFETMVGQEAVVQALQNALNKQVIHHAYLFTGTRGVGKTTLARLFAKCLNCKQGISATPCGVCDHCKEIDAGNFVDLFEIDAASRTKVEDTRELLDNVPYAPSKGRYKVYLIDEVHMLSTHSFNALLKTLEEPPSHVIFILATTELDKLPATILSRCLQFHLLHLQPDEIERQLKTVLADQNITYEDEAVKLIAQAAEGSMRDGLSLLDQALAFSGSNHLEAMPLHQLYGSVPEHTIKALWQAILDKQFQAINEQCQQLAHSGANFTKLLNQLIQITYEAALNSQDEKQTGYHRIYDMLLEGKKQLHQAPTMRLGFEMCLLKAATFYDAAASNQPVQTVVVQAAAPAAAAPANPTPAATKAPTQPVTAAAQPTQQTKPLLTLPISNWTDFLNQLGLRPATKLLAANCSLESQTDNKIQLAIANKHKALLNHQQIKNIEAAIHKATGQSMKVSVQCKEEVADTPHQQDVAIKTKAEQDLRQQFNQDPAVQALKSQFGASIENVQPMTTKD